MRTFAASILFLATISIAGAQPLPSPHFYTTQNSDDWVSHSIQLQTRYTRVLLVTTGSALTAIDVVPMDLNNPKATGTPTRYPVDKVFSTLQAAADAAEGGDLVAILPGTYNGMFVREKVSCGDGKYIHFKAMGAPGSVIVTNCAADAAGAPLSHHMIHLFAAHHIVLDGLHVAGQTGPGLPQAGLASGILIGASFVSTGKMTHHIVLNNIYSHNHQYWGMHSTDSYTVLMQDSVYGRSCREHSAYVSDGSDDYVIRRNVFFGSTGCGLQCNIDADTCLRKMSQMKEFVSVGPLQPNRQWAKAILKFAAEQYGPHNFPDGIGENFIIEENVVYGNGRGSGGGGFNFAGLVDSLIQNNLLYDNHAHGFAMWNNYSVFERELQKPGPATAADVTPEALPLFGCRNNLIRNNTVLLDVPDRYALGAINGSYGCTLRNNVIINQTGLSIEFTADSIWQTDSGYNIARGAALNRYSMYSTVPYSPNPPPMPEEIAALAKNLDRNNHSILGVDLPAFAQEVVRYNLNPWLMLEGHYWRLNPERPDFRPCAGSKLLVSSGDPTQLPLTDLEGRKRISADIGCYRFAEK